MAAPFANITFQINKAQNITQGVSGQIGVLGNVTDEGDTGLVVVQFVPDAQTDASFRVMGRSQIQDANQLPPGIMAVQVPWVPIPYQRISLGNVASDYAFVSDDIESANGPAVILIPASGMQVGLLCSCTTLFPCTVFVKTVVGTGSV
jgi:hypothetical protein